MICLDGFTHKDPKLLIIKNPKLKRNKVLHAVNSYKLEIN
jgi:hypothetical protein